ncbi:MAG: SDR family oxidoreductase [Bacteroidetes bacterium]|nr:SDR family oxidoreductase [Bacteroidota bacterium]
MQSKVVIITGGGSGIGKACASTFLARGYRVVISGRRMEKLQEVISEFKSSSEHLLAVQADVSVEEDAKRIIDETLAKFGRIDVLINNAGISMRALFEEMDLSVLKRLMDTNFWGAVYCTKYALPHLLESKGSVVGISSIAGKKGLPGRTGYSASKFALEGFLETLRIENLKKDLHVLVACPGFTASEIRISSLSADGSAQGESPREENKMMSAQTVAHKIAEAVKYRKRDLVLTFNGRFTVWLNKFFPAFMDKLVYKHMAKEPGSPFK